MDGFHELETLMAPLALADEIEVSHAHTLPAGTVTLSCNDPTLSSGPDNLCLRAAHAFQKASGLHESLAITLLKKIPHGAGLGGGSSDAAAVLKGMNILFDEPFVFEELYQLAASLGSDVPFFLNARPRWCHGRGELLGEEVSLSSWPLLLIKPPFPIPTAWAYQHVDIARSSQEMQVIDNIALVNDLEVPVFKKYCLLPIMKQWLLQQPDVRASWMSGSGSTMIAVLNQNITDHDIITLKEKISSEFGETCWIKETTFLNK